MPPVIKSTTKRQRESASRPYETKASRRQSTHTEQFLAAGLNYLSDELKSSLNDVREFCEIKLEAPEPYENNNYVSTSAESIPNIIAENWLREIKLENTEPNVNSTFCGTSTFVYQNPYPSAVHPYPPPVNPVSDVLNYHLYHLGEKQLCGLKFDINKPKVNALLWRIQEAMRIEKMSTNENTAISEINRVLRSRSNVPDIDETCEITINPKLARHPANQCRDFQYRLSRCRNNQASKASRMIKNANKEHVFNDVYEMQTNYERLTRRWAMEEAVSIFLEETLANIMADQTSTYKWTF